MTRQELKAKWPALQGIPLEHGPGWYRLIDHIMFAIYAAGFDHRRDEIRQIKEKFGTLRFYVECDVNSLGSIDEIGKDSSKRQKGIDQAIEDNDASGKICDECGSPGRLLVAAGWWSTRCPEHAPPGSVPPGEYFALQEHKRRGIQGAE